MEYVQLFDENGNALDQSLLRDENAFIPEGTYYMVVLVIIENDGKYLMQLTSKEKNSVIALTGGIVSFGDDNYKTCFKEVKEELGFDLKKDDVTFLGFKKVNKALVNVYYTKQKINIKDLVLQESEVADVYWLSRDEINKLISDGKFRPTNVAAFEILDDYTKSYDMKTI